MTARYANPADSYLKLLDDDTLHQLLLDYPASRQAPFLNANFIRKFDVA